MCGTGLHWILTPFQKKGFVKAYAFAPPAPWLAEPLAGCQSGRRVS